MLSALHFSQMFFSVTTRPCVASPICAAFSHNETHLVVAAPCAVHFQMSHKAFAVLFWRRPQKHLIISLHTRAGICAYERLVEKSIGEW